MMWVCGAPALEWCDNPDCRRARCARCTVGAGGGGGSSGTATGNNNLTLSIPSASPAAIGRTIIKCGWCNVRLCRACAPGRLAYCDVCNRGACSDCVSTLADRPLGIIRTCVGRGGNCGAGVCWRCARTVGRSKKITDGISCSDDRKIDTVGSAGDGNSPARKYVPRSPARAGLTNGGGGGGGGKFEALKFASEEQYRDASPRQTLCGGCAENKVGKLNLYRRIDMSPRPPC